MFIRLLFGRHTHLGIFPCEKEKAVDVLKDTAHGVFNLFLPGNFLEVKWINAKVRLPQSLCKLSIRSSQPCCGREQHFISLMGWAPWVGEGLQGRGWGWGPLQWLLPLIQLVGGRGETPYSTQQGVEINGSPHAAEACVTVNSTGWHGPHRLLYEVHCCKFSPSACSSVSKMNRSVVIRIHCFQGTCWITSFPTRREHYRF